MGLWTLHGVYRRRLTLVTLIGRAQPRVRAQPELSPATARLTGSPFGSRSTADRTFAPFREFPAFSHSAAASSIESRDSLIDVQGCAGLARCAARPASFCQAVPPLLCDCSQSTAQLELLSPPPCPPSFLCHSPPSLRSLPSFPFLHPSLPRPLLCLRSPSLCVTARHVPWVSLPGSFVVTLRPSGSSHSSFCLHTSGRWTFTQSELVDDNGFFATLFSFRSLVTSRSLAQY